MKSRARGKHDLSRAPSTSISLPLTVPLCLLLCLRVCLGRASEHSEVLAWFKLFEANEILLWYRSSEKPHGSTRIQIYIMSRFSFAACVHAQALSGHTSAPTVLEHNFFSCTTRVSGRI